MDLRRRSGRVDRIAPRAAVEDRGLEESADEEDAALDVAPLVMAVAVGVQAFGDVSTSMSHGQAAWGVGVAYAFGITVAIAWWARVPGRRRGLPRGFAAAREHGRSLRPGGTSDAIRFLRVSSMGRLVEYHEFEGSRWTVSVYRAAERRCGDVAGYVTGLFEAAWASGVVLEHARCGDSTCTYLVARRNRSGVAKGDRDGRAELAAKRAWPIWWWRRR